MKKFTKMKRTLLGSFAFLSVSLFPIDTLSQEETSGSQDPDFGLNVLPPSPTASALAEYAEVPVSHNSGSAGLSIPLHNLSDGKLSVPVSLSYRSGGVKVDQIASNVGMGWSLLAGGVITRTVRGLPDEDQNGQLNNPIEFPIDLPDDADYVQQVANGAIDSEPDMFSFNFGGQAGQFVLSSDGSAFVMPFQNLKIEHDLNNGQLQTSTLMITTPDGVQYFFGFDDAVERSYSSSSCGSFTGLAAITSWYMTKILHPDGNEITFTYGDSNYDYASGISSTKTVQVGYGTCYEDLSGSSTCVNFLNVEGKFLEGIHAVNGSIEFEHDFDRLDMTSGTGDPGIKSIRVHNANGALIKRFNLDYDFVETLDGPNTQASNEADSYKYRMYLTSLTQVGADGGALPPHEFQYRSPHLLPRRLSFDQDHWGFYNEANNSSFLANEFNTAYYQADDFYDNLYNVGGSKEPSESAIDYGCMEFVKYPTGGKDFFTYEPHDYSRIGSGNLNEPLIQTFTQHVNSFCPDGDSCSIFSPLIEEQTFDFNGAVNATIHIHMIAQESADVGGGLQNTGIQLVSLNDAGTEISYVPGNLDGWEFIDGVSPYYELMQTLEVYMTPGTYTLTAQTANAQDYATISVVWQEQAKDADGNLIFITEKPAGGVRIREIKTHDGLSSDNDITRVFHYDSEEGKSTGTISGIPSYHYASYTEWCPEGFEGIGGCVVESCNFMTLTSNSQVNINGFGGAHIVYDYVEEWLGEYAQQGKTTYDFEIAFSTPGNVIHGEVISSMPHSNTDWNSGTLKSKKVFKNVGGNFIPVSTEEHQYGYQFDGNDGSLLNGDILKGIIVRERHEPALGFGETILCTEENVEDQLVVWDCDGMHPYPNMEFETYPGEWHMAGAASCFAFFGMYPVYHQGLCFGQEPGTELPSLFPWQHLDINYYNIYSFWRPLTSTTTRIYDSEGNHFIENRIEYSFDNPVHAQPTKTVSYGSNQETISNTINYPHDYDLENLTNLNSDHAQAIETLMEGFEIAIPVEVISTVEDANGVKTTSSFFTEYGFVEDDGTERPKPIRLWKAATGEGLSDFSASHLDASGDLVLDPSMELLQEIGYGDGWIQNQVIQRGELQTSIITGYNNTVAMAQASNARASEIAFTGFEDPQTAGWDFNEENDFSPEAHTGDKSRKVGGPDGAIQGPSITVSPHDQHQSIQLSAWVKTDGVLQNQNARLILTSTLRGGDSAPFPVAQDGETIVFEELSAVGEEWEMITFEIDLAAIRSNYEVASEDMLDVQFAVLNFDENTTLYIDDIRIHPSDALMTTVNHDFRSIPVSVTDANHLTREFDYDEFARYIRGKDVDGNIVTELDYHYGTLINDDLNFVHSTVPRHAETASLDNLSANDVNETFEYSDGLGRVIQVVGKRATPGHRDLISFTDYDNFGLVRKQFLPYEDMGPLVDGSYRGNAQVEQTEYYISAERVAHSTFAFSDVKYENSPAARVKESSAPGAMWSLELGHTIENEIGLNQGLEVRLWTMDNNGNVRSQAYYDSNELVVSQLIDENEVPTFSYTDKQGRVICEKKAMETGTDLVTTYVYNPASQLVAVIPPQALVLMEEAQVFDEALLSEVSDLLYKYGYDSRGRQTTIKLPGAVESQVFYNDLDLLVLTRSGNQIQNGTGSFVKYDNQGRLLITGQVNLEAVKVELGWSEINRENIQNLIAEGFLFETRSGNDFEVNLGYSNNAFPTSQAELQIINYYDDYDFDSDGVADVIAEPLVGIFAENLLAESTLGQQTGMLMKVLDGAEDATFLQTTSFYDKRGQLIQAQSNTYDGGTNLANFRYDFLGNMTNAKEVQTNLTDEDLCIELRMKYDHMSRLTHVFHKLNDDPEMLLAKNRYNGISQLIETNFGVIQEDNWLTPEDESIRLQSIDFSYNIRGWLTHINNVNLSNDNILADSTETIKDVSKVIIEQVTLEVKDAEDDSGDIAITIRDNRNVTGQNADNQEVEMSQEGARNTRIAVEEEIEQTQLLVIKGDEITLDLSSLEIEEGTSTAEVLDMATEILTTELVSKGVTDPQTIKLISQQLLSYLATTVGNVYFNDDDDDLWGMEILYDKTEAGLTNTPLFNGNISEIHWNDIHGPKRSYSYNYDWSNRILAGSYREWDSNLNGGTGDWQVLSTPGKYDLSNISYDANGNILTLNRHGFIDQGDAGLFLTDPMDVLGYNYDGNQLTKVTDAATVHGFNDFQDVVDQAEEYTYDANGNMVSDANKGIAVEYNSMNLPIKVLWSDGRMIEYIYSASGIRLEKLITYQDGSTSSTRYIGSLVYQDDELAFGFTDFGTFVPESVLGSEFKYEYEYRDHLENVRLRFADNDGNGVITTDEANNEVLQVNDYYPFGLEHKGNVGSILSDHQFKFNGKELDDEFDLNWYAMDVRLLDPQLGRWHALDPVVHHSYSPYSAFDNNPVFWKDPSGANGEGCEQGDPKEIPIGDHANVLLTATQQQIIGILNFFLETVFGEGVNSDNFDDEFSNGDNFDKSGPETFWDYVTNVMSSGADKLFDGQVDEHGFDSHISVQIYFTFEPTGISDESGAFTSFNEQGNTVTDQHAFSYSQMLSLAANLGVGIDEIELALSRQMDQQVNYSYSSTVATYEKEGTSMEAPAYSYSGTVHMYVNATYKPDGDDDQAVSFNGRLMSFEHSTVITPHILPVE